MTMDPILTPKAPHSWQAPEERSGPAPGVLVIAVLLVGGVMGAGGLLLAIPAIIIVSLGYFPFFWVRGGQTPGMRMFGLKVVMDRDGGPVTLGPAILRLIGYWVDGFVFYLGFIWVLIDKRRRGWHDLIAGTVVIQRN
jgi:uncharacterized RDD family membrane protein YckC